MSRAPFNELAREYDAWFDQDGRLVFACEVEAFRKILPGLPKPWLEIGAGSGRFAEAIGIGTGVEPSARMAEIARKRGIDTRVARGEDRLFGAGSYGTVFLIVTLCFLDKPAEVLREAGRILAPDGKIVLGLVLKESPWGRYYEQKKAEGHRFYRHAVFYRHDEVTALLAQAGFTIRKTVSTLFQGPEAVKDIEEPRDGYYPEAGFTVVVAGRETGAD